MKLTISMMALTSLLACYALNGYRNYSVADGVTLAVTHIGSDKIQLKIRNGRAAPIFLGYQTDDKTKISSVGYRLVCYQSHSDVDGTDFGPDWHGSMGLNPLNPGEDLEFEVEPLPSLRRNCSISVGYYSDVKALDIIRKVVASADTAFTAEESEFVEQSKQKVIVTLNINSSGQ